MRFHLEHESLFSLKVHPKMIERVINESFQKDSVVAIASPVEMGIIDVFIQPPKEEMNTCIRTVSEQPDKYSIQQPLPDDSSRFVYNTDEEEDDKDYVHKIRPARCLGSRYTVQDLLKLTVCVGKKTSQT